MNSLMGAAQNGHYDVVEFLVQQKGIKLNEVNNWGRTAIELASEFSKKDVKELLKKQKDIIFDDKMPETETKQTFGRYIPGTIYRVNANPIQPNKFGIS